LLRDDLLTKKPEKTFYKYGESKECRNGDAKHLIGLNYEN